MSSTAEHDVGEGPRRDRAAARDPLGVRVAVALWIPMYLDRLALEVHGPALADAGLGVERPLDVPVVAQGRVGGLDQQQHVGGLGQRGSIKVGPVLQQDDIRLRLGVRQDDEGALVPHNCLTVESSDEPVVQERHTPRVP